MERLSASKFVYFKKSNNNNKMNKNNKTMKQGNKIVNSSRSQNTKQTNLTEHLIVRDNR